jgi:hypothetical protein
MTVPAHFSLELPRRCMTLINELLPAAGKAFVDPANREMGGLTSTFLLSMAGPIVTLPIERIERQLQRKEREGYADDRKLNPTLSSVLQDLLGGGRFGRAPFFVPNQWSFAELSPPRTSQTVCPASFAGNCLPTMRLYGRQNWKLHGGAAVLGTLLPMEASHTLTRRATPRTTVAPSRCSASSAESMLHVAIKRPYCSIFYAFGKNTFLFFCNGG